MTAALQLAKRIKPLAGIVSLFLAEVLFFTVDKFFNIPHGSSRSKLRHSLLGNTEQCIERLKGLLLFFYWCFL